MGYGMTTGVGTSKLRRGRAVRNGIVFGIAANGRDFKDLAEALTITPTRFVNLGDTVQSHGGPFRSGRSVWQLDSTVAVESNRLDDHGTWLAKVLEPFRHVIEPLSKDNDIDVGLRIRYVWMAPYGGFTMASDVLRPLLTLCKWVDIVGKFPFVHRPV